MSKFIKLIYIILFLALILHPHFISGHVWIFPKAYAQSLITIFILGIAFLIYFLHQRDIKRKEKELQSVNQELSDKFKYIGDINRQLALLKNFTSDLLSNPKFSKKEKHQIFQELLATALVSVAKVNWGLLRFVNIESGKTVKEFIFTNKEYVVMKNGIGNKELLRLREQPAAIKLLEDLFVIPTTEQQAVIQGYLVFPKPVDPVEDERWILQAITDQAQLFFKYLY